MKITNKIEEIKEEYYKIKNQISDPSVISNHKLYKKLSTRFKEISEILTCFQNLNNTKKIIKENQSDLKRVDDEELAKLLLEENKELESEAERLLKQLKTMLLPKDKNDMKNAIIEIRAGTGGEEAALFTADLYRMYASYIKNKGWKIDIMNTNPTGKGGFKEISFAVIGKNAYGNLKYESGVHRVQRVPETESSGRIHTSAASVVVLPEAEEIDLKIDENDLKIDVYRSSGPGGQSVNTTDSAVRITHIPTGTVVTCQDEKSQHKNKKKALKVLRSRLLDKKIQKQHKSRSNKRKLMVGTGDRSAKIRTYNFPQTRITDHRINYTTHNLENIIKGDLDPLIEVLQIENQKDFFGEK